MKKIIIINTLFLLLVNSGFSQTKYKSWPINKRKNFKYIVDTLIPGKKYKIQDTVQQFKKVIPGEWLDNNGHYIINFIKIWTISFKKCLLC